MVSYAYLQGDGAWNSGWKMDTNTIALVQTVAIFLALFGFWWRLDSKINLLDAKLTTQIKDLDARLSGETKSVESRLSGEIGTLDTKLSGEVKEVRQASEDAHKEIINRLNAVAKTQATHSERFNTIGERFNTLDERFNTVQTQIQAVDDKVDRLRDDR